MDAALAEQLRLLEERLLDPEVRHDRAAAAALLDPEFLEIGSSGRLFTREQILAFLAEEAPSAVELRDFAARTLAPGVALVRWRSVRPDGAACLRSSVWIRRDGGWRMIFHQGTRISETGE